MLFDFDMSGVLTTDNKWFLDPNLGYILRDYNKQLEMATPSARAATNLFDIDDFAFRKFSATFL